MNRIEKAQYISDHLAEDGRTVSCVVEIPGPPSMKIVYTDGSERMVSGLLAVMLLKLKPSTQTAE